MNIQKVHYIRHTSSQESIESSACFVHADIYMMRLYGAESLPAAFTCTYVFFMSGPLWEPYFSRLTWFM